MKLSKKSKMVKGVVYDDQSVLEGYAFMTADMVSNVLDHKESMEEFLNECRIENPDDNTIPTADELNTYEIMLSMIYPFKGARNLIIPSKSIDNTLYNDLKKVDIGHDILSKFDEIRSNKMIEENKDEIIEDENNRVKIHFVNRDGELIDTLEFDNESEAADFIGENFAKYPNKPKTYVGIAEPLFSKEF